MSVDGMQECLGNRVDGAAANLENAIKKVRQEFDWQKSKLPQRLRGEVMCRIIINDGKGEPRITIDKHE